MKRRTVEWWYEVRDSLLDDDLGGANIFHDEASLVPPLNQRNQFLDFLDGAALRFVNGRDLRLDGTFETEEW